ncbi:uncharacterized protein LOC144714572 [Wolffia australiana]
MDWCFGREDDSIAVPNLSQSSDRLYAEDGSPSSKSWFDWEMGRDDSSEKFFTKSMKGDDNTASSFETKNSCKDYKPASRPNDTKGSEEQSSHEDLLFSDLPDHPLQGSLERIDFWDSGFTGETLLYLEKPSDSSDGDLSSAMFCDPNAYFLNNASIDESRACPERRYTQALRETLDSTTGLPRSASTLAEPSPSEEGSALQATILQDLEQVLSQMDMKLRICIRDALYRLATTSNHHHFQHDHHRQNFSPSNHKKRSRDTGSKERETNAIDRAIASMMFTNLVYPTHERKW